MSDDPQQIDWTYKRFCEAIKGWYNIFDKQSPCWLGYFIENDFCDKNGKPYKNALEQLDEEFKDPDQCSLELLNFDPQFPLPPKYDIKQRDKLVFDVLRYCYQYLSAPSVQSIMNASKDINSRTNKKHLTKRTAIDTIDESTEYEATPINPTLNVNARSFTMNNTNTMDVSLVNTVIDDRKEATESNPKSPSKSKGYKNTKKQNKWNDAALRIYNPDSAYRGQGNVDIPRRFTEETAPNAIKEDIKHLFPFLDKSVAVQCNDGQVRTFDTKNGGNIKIFNVDLHKDDEKEINEQKETKEEEEKILYFVVKQQEKTKNRNYEWKTIGLLDENTIKNIYGISSNKLPKSSRKMATFLKQLHCRRITVAEIKQLFKTTEWVKKVDVLHKINNNMRTTVNITKEEFKKKMKNIFGNKDDNEIIELIPILLFRDNKKQKHYIEHICIISINDMVDIGVSLKYNEKNDEFIVKGIHLDKELIGIHHELALPEHHECHCLDNFKCNIDCLSIGNCDNILNQRNQYKQKCEEFKEFLNSIEAIKIATDNPDLQSIHKKLQTMLPNGKNIKIAMDTPKAESSINEASTNGASIIYFPVFIHPFTGMMPQFPQYPLLNQNIFMPSNANIMPSVNTANILNTMSGTNTMNARNTRTGINTINTGINSNIH